MQSALSKIWTRVAVSISYVDNLYATCTSTSSQNKLEINSDEGVLNTSQF